MIEEQKITLSPKEILSAWLAEILISIKDKKLKRIDTRRLWPLLVIVIIVSVTITHEATYAGSFEAENLRFVGWFYAFAINLAILIGEFFTQWTTTRRIALTTFVIATIGSGALNIAYVRPWDYFGVEEIFAWGYALLPTIIIVCLGLLSSKVAKIAKTQEARWAKEGDISTEDLQYECFCGERFSKPIQLASHTKKHVSELKNNNIDTGAKAYMYFVQNYPDRPFYPPMTQLESWTNREHD